MDPNFAINVPGVILAPMVQDRQQTQRWLKGHIDGLAQDWSNSNALAMELLHSYTKPSICV